MRILFVTNLYPPNVVGGYERLCAAVAEAFSAVDHRVTVLTSSFGGGLSHHSNQTVHQALRLLVEHNVYTPFSGTEQQREDTNRSNVYMTKEVIARSVPDLIFCWNLYGLHYSVLETLAHSGVPLVVMLTDNWLLSMVNPEYMGKYFVRKVFDADPQGDAYPCVPLLQKYQYCAIFGSSFMQDLYVDAGFAFHKSAVVHNGVQTLLSSQSQRRTRTTLVHDGELRLLYAGRVVDLKGVHTILEALPLVRERCGADVVRLTILGDIDRGEYASRLNRIIEENEISDHVDFRSPVPSNQLFDIFQDHDVYVFPSLYEPFSLLLISALESGIPTIASRVGGNLEIVNEEKSGLLFDKGRSDQLAECVLRIHSSPSLRQALSLGGVSVASEFSFTRMINGMQDAIREFLK